MARGDSGRTRAAADLDRARPAGALDGECRRLGPRRRPRMAALRARARGLRPAARGTRTACSSRPGTGRNSKRRRLPLRRQRRHRLAPGPAVARAGTPSVGTTTPPGPSTSATSSRPTSSPACSGSSPAPSSDGTSRASFSSPGWRSPHSHSSRPRPLACEPDGRARPDDTPDRPDLRSHSVPLLWFEGLYERGSEYANPVAAVPSLHAAYTLLITLFLWRSAPRWARPLLVGISAGDGVRAHSPPSTTSSTSCSAGRHRDRGLGGEPRCRPNAGACEPAGLITATAKPSAMPGQTKLERWLDREIARAATPRGAPA